MTDAPRKKTFSFGGCDYAKTSPPRSRLSAETKMLNITLSFEDALKLSLSVDECVRRLNSYDRSTKAGKRSALNVAIHLDSQRITINEAVV